MFPCPTAASDLNQVQTGNKIPRKLSSSIFQRSLIASALMLLTAAYLHFGIKNKDIPPLMPLSEFPTQIGEWKGRVSHFDKKIYDVLGVDDSFLCNYKNKRNETIQLYIGYYRSQREGELIHSPKNCMPGSGWNIVESSIVTIDVPRQGAKKVIEMLLEKANEKMIMLYWFQSRGRIISSEYWQKIYLVIDSVVKRRTDGSFVRLIAPVLRNEKETEKYLKDFAKELFPILDKYIPDETI